MPLLGTFQDDSTLNYVMPVAERGELLDLIKTHGHLSRAAARFYAAEVVSALVYLHSIGTLAWNRCCPGFCIWLERALKG